MVIWSTIDASCPVCAHRLRLREVGSGFAVGQDSDLFVRMRGKHVIQAEIHTCHSCRFSGYTADFLRDVSEETRRLFLQEVAPTLLDETPAARRRAASTGEDTTGGRSSESTSSESTSSESTSSESTSSGDGDAVGEPSRRSRGGARRLMRTPLPHVQYVWATSTAAALGLSAHEQGMRLLRAYWSLRIPPSNQLPARRVARLERRCLTQAIRRLRQDLRLHDDPHVLYLVAELCRRNGNFLLAGSYFRRFLAAPRAASYLREAAQKLSLLAAERERVALSMEDLLYNPAPGHEEDR